jgi:hypothetical protein
MTGTHKNIVCILLHSTCIHNFTQDHAKPFRVFDLGSSIKFSLLTQNHRKPHIVSMLLYEQSYVNGTCLLLLFELFYCLLVSVIRRLRICLLCVIQPSSACILVAWLPILSARRLSALFLHGV